MEYPFKIIIELQTVQSLQWLSLAGRYQCTIKHMECHFRSCEIGTQKLGTRVSLISMQFDKFMSEAQCQHFSTIPWFPISLVANSVSILALNEITSWIETFPFIYPDLDNGIFRCRPFSQKEWLIWIYFSRSDRCA